jgi:putative FmdB family regulatory protein
MPTYDFICNNCEKRFEVFMTFAEYGKKNVSCVHCQSDNVRRRMTKVRIAKSVRASDPPPMIFQEWMD